MNDHVIAWNIPGLNIPITNVVVMSWIAMAIIIVSAFLATRKLKLVPKGGQNVAEFVVETVNNFVKGIMPTRWKTYAAYIGTVGIFLAIANTLGALFMTELSHGVISPITRTLAVPAAFAVMTIVIAIASGIRYHGLIGFFKSLFKPTPIMFPFKLLEFIIKPLSLCLRLYGNIFGAYIVMEMILMNLPFVFPAVACVYFDLFDGLLQAFVFVLLTSLYIAEEVETEEH
jgi:F-type H+-transporting ATPase subunit a